MLFFCQIETKTWMVYTQKQLARLHMFPLVCAIHINFNKQSCYCCSTLSAKHQVFWLQLCVFPECKQSCAPPATAGHRRRHHHDQLGGGWCVLRADYPGRRVLFCAHWLWDCTLCVLLIRPQRSPAADRRADSQWNSSAVFLHCTFQFWALDFVGRCG